MQILRLIENYRLDCKALYLSFTWVTDLKCSKVQEKESSLDSIEVRLVDSALMVHLSALQFRYESFRLPRDFCSGTMGVSQPGLNFIFMSSMLYSPLTMTMPVKKLNHFLRIRAFSHENINRVGNQSFNPQCSILHVPCAAIEMLHFKKPPLCNYRQMAKLGLGDNFDIVGLQYDFLSCKEPPEAMRPLSVLAFIYSRCFAYSNC